MRLAILAIGLLFGGAAFGQGLSIQGMPGHVAMPSGEALPDGQLVLSANGQGGKVRRGTLAFQITPRITGAFRYGYLKDFATDGSLSLYDRSFDLRFRLTSGQGSWPAIALGLQDFGGTGVYGGEYLVASKRYGDRVMASGGIGWGRYGSYGGGRNPLSVFSDRFKDRPVTTGVHDTGKPALDRLFRGPAALFMGLDWQATPRLRISVEHSSDGISAEVERLGFQRRSPINLGLSYQLGRGEVSAAFMHGSTLSLGYAISLDPRQGRAPSGLEAGPPLLGQGADRKAHLAQDLKAQGLRFEGMSVKGQEARLAYSDRTWPWAAQATGRVARVMSRDLPPDVTTFHIESQVRGMAVRGVSLHRADLAELELAPDGAWQLWSRAKPFEAKGQSQPQMAWRLSPWIEPSFFDPDSPFRADMGLEVSAEVSPMRGLWFSGAVRGKVAGDLDRINRASTSVLPHVRSDTARYFRKGDLRLPWAVVEYFSKPAPDLYTRISLGLLETAFGGASVEALWAPVGRPLALGLEVNALKKRDYEGLGFQDYRVMSGHASAYYDFGGGYHGQLDLGRYLAGDWGGTARLTRRFGNGVEVGAFATLTDAGFEAFGEGAFDKGITLSLPLTVLSGQPSQRQAAITLRPILRDGGARVEVPNRLFELTKREREAARGEGWARVWR